MSYRLVVDQASKKEYSRGTEILVMHDNVMHDTIYDTQKKLKTKKTIWLIC